ncbi:hypothetical protein [Tuwongella immobilis]|uniref:Secreted protein n=1 Tax=Tuwongella immobilis TaxID=692036 RepID=A0A6C2YMS1_9BACT|nr:hypothetical protein [Tuwongella immobilis]VIP02509.1 unnamed protein product [Tuwongella immobilis]VTS01616.1 unnamed protein product [Tuwongella immobilis]
MTRTTMIRRLATVLGLIVFACPTSATYAQYSGYGGSGVSIGIGAGFNPITRRFQVMPTVNFGVNNTNFYGATSPGINSTMRGNVTPFYSSRRGSSDPASIAGTSNLTSDRARGSRRVLDERLYELGGTSTSRADTPNTTSLIERALTNAPLTEIRSGITLNQLVEYIQSSAIDAPPTVNLPAGLVTRLNYATKNVDGQATQVGLLRNGGKFPWPNAFQEILTAEQRQEIEQAMQTASAQMQEGKIDPEVKATLEKASKRMDGLLTFRVQDLVATDFMDAKKFLREFDATLKGLSSTDVAKLLRNPNDWRSITTVMGMVKYLTSNQIRFAPCSLGNEAAYDQMYTLLVNYVNDAGISPIPKNAIATPTIPTPR